MPPELAGKSDFSFSGAIAYFMCGGLGMCEYDISNALFEALRDLVEDMPPAVLTCCESCEQILQEVAIYLSTLADQVVTPSMCEKLTISVGFGGTLHRWMPMELGCYKIPTGERGQTLRPSSKQ